MRKTYFTITAIVVSLLFICGGSLASASWMKAFNDLYKPKADTPLKKSKCGVCHVRTNGGGLNSYGKMLDGEKVNAESMKAIEDKDADKDGISNINEIKAGTLPGDAKSKPKTD